MKLPILTIAGGKNSLLAFDEYPGLVIYNASEGYDLGKNRHLKVLSGQPIWELAETLENETMELTSGTDFRAAWICRRCCIW
jgi:UDP-N-acetylenolpyruvoylglucosamine reductase